MPYIVEVDQSRKIEQSGATVLAFSNDISGAILIPSSVKTEAFRALRARGKPKGTALLLLFAACLYLLLADCLTQLEKVVIDEEYSGKGPDIKSFLLEYTKKGGGDIQPENIVFAKVGRGSPADRKARAVRLGEDREYRQVTLDQLLEVME